MSLFGALSSSVSGIQAQGTAIGIISDNISNVNTVGYKAGSQVFSTLVTDSGSTVAYSPGGVRAQNRQLIDEQGLVQTTNSPLDVAISGDGFFVVSDNPGGLSASGSMSYTRAGSFRTDSLGNFTNTAGQFLQAWPVDGEGRLPGETGNANTTLSSLLESLETVNIGSASGDASNTSLVEVGLNLNASQNIFKGAGDIGTPGSDNANTENRGVRSNDLLVPNANLTAGDTITATVNGGNAYTFTYGGFEQSDDILAGAILGAASLTDQFNTGVTNNDTFTITRSGDSSNPATFTFTTTSSPNTSAGFFNSMATLAEAIDRTSGMTARVETVGGEARLSVAASDAREGLTFTQGVGATADFPTSLGLAGFAAVTTNRWNTLDGLADLANDETLGELGATIINGNTSSASIDIFNQNPLTALTFTDSDGADAVLGEMGISNTIISATYNSSSTSTSSMSSGDIAPHFERGVRIYDSLGVGHDVRVGFLKTGLNTWFSEIYVLDSDEVTGDSRQIAAGEIEFNGDGSLQSIADTLTTEVTANWSNNSNPSVISFDFGTAGTAGSETPGDTNGLRQFSGPYNVDFINQNGAPVGLLDSVTIDEEGFITANFNNGETKVLYRIPLADFSNPNGLNSKTGNIFSQTFASGEVNLKRVGDGGVGAISPSSLESSNSELSEELTDMIVAQRAYQASARVITTADELLDELSRIVG